MQSDARLVQNVKNSGQPGADLRRQPNSLCFAAGKCAALAIERKIIEPDFDQELEPRVDFPNDVGHDLALLIGQPEPPNVFRRRVGR